MRAKTGIAEFLWSVAFEDRGMDAARSKPHLFRSKTPRKTRQKIAKKAQNANF
jgi:hypothetical protein